MKRNAIALIVFLCSLPLQTLAQPTSPPGNYSVSWLGNSFSGANDKWVQNFFIHMNTTPDGICYTWSHWDEGGKKFVCVSPTPSIVSSKRMP